MLQNLTAQRVWKVRFISDQFHVIHARLAVPYPFYCLDRFESCLYYELSREPNRNRLVTNRSYFPNTGL